VKADPTTPTDAAKDGNVLLTLVPKHHPGLVLDVDLRQAAEPAA
jgi:hypothetical protein